MGNTPKALHTHHVLRKSYKGSHALTNLLVLHEECHMQITHTQNETLIAKFKNKVLLIIMMESWKSLPYMAWLVMKWLLKTKAKKTKLYLVVIDLK